MTFPVIDNLRAQIVSMNGKTLADIEHAQRHDESSNALRELRDTAIAQQLRRTAARRDLSNVGRQLGSMAVQRFVDDLNTIADQEAMSASVYDAYITGDDRTESTVRATESRATTLKAGYVYGPTHGTEAIITLDTKLLPSEVQRVLAFGIDDAPSAAERSADPVYGYGGLTNTTAFNANSPLLWDKEFYGQDKALHIPASAGNHVQAPNPVWGHSGATNVKGEVNEPPVVDNVRMHEGNAKTMLFNGDSNRVIYPLKNYLTYESTVGSMTAVSSGVTVQAGLQNGPFGDDGKTFRVNWNSPSTDVSCKFMADMMALPAGTYTFSIWVKGDPADKFSLGATGTTGLSTGSSFSSVQATEGWTRVQTSFTLTATNALSPQLAVFASDASTGLKEAPSAKPMYFWGPQLELAATATTYATPHKSHTNYEFQALISPERVKPEARVCVASSWHTGNNWYYGLMPDGSMTLILRTSTETNWAAVSNVLPFKDGDTFWVRATVEWNVGGNSVIKHYYSADGATWTLHGTVSTAAILPNRDSGQLVLGTFGNKTDQWIGEISKFSIRRLAEQDVYYLFDADLWAEGGTSYTNTLGQTTLIESGIPEVIRKSTAWLPGTAGNSISAKATNLAPTTLLYVTGGSFVSSVQNFENAGWANMPYTRLFADGTDSRARIQTPLQPVIPGKTYTFGLRVRPGPTGVAPDRFLHRIQFQGASGTINNTETFSYSITPANDGWYKIKSTFTVPLGSDSMKFYGDHYALGTQDVGQYFDISALYWAEGSSKEFTRSVRFGSTDTIILQAKVKPDKIGGVTQGLVNVLEGSNMYTLNLSTNSSLVVFHKSIDGAAHTYGYQTIGFQPRDIFWLRAEYNKGTGICTFKSSVDGFTWTSLGTSALGTAQPNPPHIWGYGGTTDTTAKTASSPMLLDLRRWKVPKALWQPDLNGNGVSIYPHNILKSVNSHLQVGVGLTPNEVVVRAEYMGGGMTTEVGGYNGYSTALKAVGTSSSGIRQIFNYLPSGTSAIKVTPNTVVTVRAAIFTPTPASSVEFRRIEYDASGATVLSLTAMPNSLNALTVGQWTVCSGTFTTGASTEYFTFDIPVGTGDGFVDGDLMYLGALAAYTGPTPPAAIIPSIRSATGIDIRARVALKDYTNNTQELINRWHGTSGAVWLLRVTSTGRLAFYVSKDGTSGSFETMIAAQALPVLDGDPIWVRATYVNNNGSGVHETKLYHSADGVTWTLTDTFLGTAIGSIDTRNNHALTTGISGAMAAAAYLYAELRDGPDGAVVAVLDPNEHVTGDTWTGLKGQPWIITRSGESGPDFRTKNCLVFRAAQTLRLPDRVDWDIPATQDYWHSSGVSLRAVVTNNPVFATYDAGTIGGTYMLFVLGGGKARLWERTGDNTTARTLDSVESINDGTFKNILAGREGSTAFMRTAGGTVTAGSWTQEALIAPTVGAAIGSYSSELIYSNMFFQWYALAKGTLTSTQKDEMAAWDGTVADEPEWLRSVCTFYWNADDEFAAAVYRQTNDVVNLAGLHSVQVGAVGSGWGYEGSVSEAGVLDSTESKQAYFRSDYWRGLKTYTDKFDRKWTLNFTAGVGLGSGKMLNRNSAVFRGSDLLTIPDRAALNPGTGSFAVAFGAQGPAASGYFMDKLSTIGYGANMVAGNSLYSVFDTGSGHQHNSGAGSSITKINEWFNFATNYDRSGNKSTFINGVAGTPQAINDHSAVSITNTNPYRIGAAGVSTQQWNAYFNRVFTTQELADLAVWNGSVATEPTWLRSGAVLYWNLDDKQCLEALVQHGLVINLAVQPNGVYKPFISGNIDMRAKIVKKSLSDQAYLIGQWESTGGQRSRLLSLTGSNSPALNYSISGTDNSNYVGTEPVVVPERAPMWVRATVDAKTGPNTYINFYSSVDGVTWTQQGTQLSITGLQPAFNSAGSITLGSHTTDSAPMNGILLQAEIRDGINGPVIAKFNPENLAVGQSTYTDSAGLKWVITRGATPQIQVLDRNAVATNGLTDSAVFTLPNRPELSFPTEDYWVGSGFRTANTGLLYLFKRGDFGSGDTGVSFVVSSNARLISKGTVSVTADSTATVNDGLYHSAVGLRTPSTMYMLLDGVSKSVAASTVGNSNRELNTFFFSPGLATTQAYAGTAEWVAYGVRGISTAQATELSNWKGKIYNEPAWLREEAAFYWNADDPACRTAYMSSNDVLNLAVRNFTITYEVSVDGGVTWTAVTNGVPAELAGAGTKLKLRARIVRPGSTGPVGRIFALSALGGPVA